MKLRILMVVVLGLSVCGVSASQDAGVSVINAGGLGEVRVEPDQAVVRLGILEERRTAAAAQRLANEAATEIAEAVRAVGIPESSIQTERLTLGPIYDFQANAREIVGYTASNTISVRVEDLDQVRAVVDAALQAGANQLNGVSFSLSDESAARQAALEAAVADARSKAQTMAGALGVTLGPILAVTEGGGSGPIAMEIAAPRMMAAQAADMGTPIAPGELTISASVNIRWGIVQGPAPPE